MIMIEHLTELPLSQNHRVHREAGTEGSTDSWTVERGVAQK